MELKVEYLKLKSSGKAQVRFALRSEKLKIPGTIFKHPGTVRPGQDLYFWNFAEHWSWEVGDTQPPFQIDHPEHPSARYDAFFGIPQGLLAKLFRYQPIAAAKYQNLNVRNCANCRYANFGKQTWQAFKDLPLRNGDQPTSPQPLYHCLITGEALDHHNILSPIPKDILQDSRQQLQGITCQAHTRHSYPVQLSPESRGPSDPSTRWVPAEDRRLHVLNPLVIMQTATGFTILPKLQITLIELAGE